MQIKFRLLKKTLALCVPVLIAFSFLMSIVFDVSAAKGENLEQIPSITTDFPNSDDNILKVDVFSAKKDIIDDWHIKGQVTNTGTETLEFVKVVAHFYDKNQTVGVTTCCYADPHTIEPGHTATFDSFVGETDMASDPDSFRLSFDWR